MNQVVLRSYLSKSWSNLGVPTSPENMPLEMSSGESSPPYEPSQPATASMSMPMEQNISFCAVTPHLPFPLPLLSDQKPFYRSPAFRLNPRDRLSCTRWRFDRCSRHR